MNKVTQNSINDKDKQNKDIRYEKEIYIKKSSTWLAHIIVYVIPNVTFSSNYHSLVVITIQYYMAFYL